MLEYMLIRPAERPLIHQATRALKFLAVDELHVYRGRQGADVAMLMRRVRQRAARDDLLCIGTSATLVSGESRAETRARIAQVGSRFFGVTVKPEHVVDETLRPGDPRRRAGITQSAARGAGGTTARAARRASCQPRAHRARHGF
jgi:ATP-dependent helicase YprA (DUF1998 family)